MKPLFFKVLKIKAYVLGSLFLLFLMASLALSYLLKDRIYKAVQENAAQRLNAQVEMDPAKLHLSLWRNFPNLTIAQGDLRVLGKGVFAGDTLFSAKELSFSVNFWSMLFGGELSVRAIYLDQPRILAKKLASGQANWDILIPQKEKKPAQNLAINIRRWQIRNGYIVYDDRQARHLVALEQINHRGRGNLGQPIAELYTQTDVKQYRLVWAGQSYFEHPSLALTLDLKAEPSLQKYTFKKMRCRLNDFALGLEGWIQNKKEGTEMDVRFQAEETEFKNLLSLVPGIYGDDFEKLKTRGTLAFSGWAKGQVKAGKLPAFQMDLQVKDGGFQYPDLPEGVSNVQIALQLENKDGKWQNTRLDLSRLHAEVGKNVADAQVRFSKLYDGEVEGKANAQLRLEDLTRVFPLPDVQLKGLFSLKATAKGPYNATQRPVMKAEVRLANGFVKSKAYPKAIEQLQLEARAENPTGRRADAKIALDKFQFSLDGEKVEGRATFQNAEDWQYDWQLKGQLDLAKLAQIYPSGGATLKGKVKGNIETSGRVSALKAQQYAKLPTSGNLQLQDFYYAHPQNLPPGLSIQAAQASFDPEKISLESMKGNLGKSDFALDGEIRHYLAYLLTGETLKGQLNFQSKKVDLSEWTSTNARGERQAVSLPQAIDFTLQASIAEVLYPKIPVRDFRGTLRLREGTLQMENVRFAALGGAFAMSGQYNPTDGYRPRYQFDFDMQNLDIASAHEAFVERKNNLRQNIKGQLSARAQLSGFLGPDLVPLYDENMGGSFGVKIPQAQMKRLSIAQSANKHLKLDDTEEMILRNLDMQATIREGKVYYTPFEFNLNEYRIAMQGNNSLAGVLDLALKIVIPKSKMSPVAEVAIAALTRQKLIGVKEMAIDFLVRGTYPNHEISPLRSDGKEIQIKNEKLKQKIDEKRSERREEMRENMQNLNKSPEEVLADAQTKAAEIRAQALREATQIETEADSLAQAEIAAAASKGKVARELAERQANTRKKTAYRRAELRRQQGERDAQKTLQNAQIIADRMRQE